MITCIEEQKKICLKYNQLYFEITFDLKVGISNNFNSGEMPIHGMRIFPEGDTAGWYLWAGEYSDADDFFKPIHISHLVETFPEIIKYLGLPPGNRFLMDGEGYEDVWFDAGLLASNTQR